VVEKGGKKQISQDVPSSRTLDVSGRSERRFRLSASLTFVAAALVHANPVQCKRDNGGLTF
jgi:hypothetical protein